jgi:hypothetical protein
MVIANSALEVLIVRHVNCVIQRSEEIVWGCSATFPRSELTN